MRELLQSSLLQSSLKPPHSHNPHAHKLFALIFCAVLSLALVLPLAAQGDPALEAKPSACGPADVSFDVKTDATQHPVAQPEPGTALLYFLQDDSTFGARPRPTSRLAIDGAWVGATHSNSYFYVSIAPGEHHLCTEWQAEGNGRHAAALHFTAQPGASYYFGAENFYTRDTGPNLRFEALDSDEGQLLIRRFALSTSHPKQAKP